MSTHTSSHQPSGSEQIRNATVEAQSDPYEIAGQRGSLRSRSTSGREPASSPRTPPRNAARQRLTTTYTQGDFATGQRTLPLRATPIGTFATR